MGNVSWTREQKEQAAIQYAIEGNLSKLSRDQSIPKSTLFTWKQDSEWVELIEQIRTEKAEEHIAKYNKIVDMTQDKTIELIPNITSARESALIACMTQDKSLLLQGRPTSIQGQSSDMKSLANEFRKLSQQWDEKQVNVIKTIDKKKGPI